MKLFQDSQRNFAILGINSNQQTSFDSKFILTYLVNGLGFISSTVFLFYKANTFQEYSNNAYVTTSITTSIAVFTIVVFKTKALFKFIKNFEDFFEKSEYMLK